MFVPSDHWDHHCELTLICPLDRARLRTSAQRLDLLYLENGGLHSPLQREPMSLSWESSGLFILSESQSAGLS